MAKGKLIVQVENHLIFKDKSSKVFQKLKSSL